MRSASFSFSSGSFRMLPSSCLLLLIGMAMTTTGVSAQNSPCDFCPMDLPYVSKPDATVVLFSGMLPTSCAAARETALSGEFTSLQCIKLRASTAGLDCGCTTEPGPPSNEPTAAPMISIVPAPAQGTTTPTDAPVSDPPTDAPVMAPVSDAPTGAPTMAPVSGTPVVVPPPPTEMPTSAPAEPFTTDSPTIITDPPTPVPAADPTVAPTTDAPTVSPTASPVTASPTAAPTATVTTAPLESTIAIDLVGAEGGLGDNSTATFEEVCAAFLEEKLGLVNVTCTLAGQEVVTDTSNSTTRFLLRSHYRGLQDDNNTTSTVQTTVVVTSAGGEDVDPEEFADLVAGALSDGADEFLEDLQEADDFFDTVDTIESTPIVETTAPTAGPTAAPDDDDDGGNLSAGAIVGIIAAAIIGLIAGVYILKSCGQDEPVAAAPSTASAVHTKPLPDGMENPADSVLPRKSPTAASRRVSRIPEGDGEDPTEGGSVMVSVAGEEVSTTSYSYSLGAVSGAGTAAAATASAASSGKKEPPGDESGTAGGGDGGGDGEMSSMAMSSLKQSMVSRQVIAPPGKLGIVIDTTLEGPVVHRINVDSIMKGTLYPGDIIVDIDGLDTRAMSAPAITALMLKTVKYRRKFTVLSEDVTN